MKSVLISIRPKWCELIARGEKTLEVRKTRPKLKTPFKVYIYCTDTRPYLVWGDVFRGDWETEFTHIRGYSREQAEKIWDVFNGNIIGEFICDNIINPFSESRFLVSDHIVNESCLSPAEIRKYSNGGNTYGWHISDLKIYDKPKPLSDFIGIKTIRNGFEVRVLERPPQSWCYVEEA